MCDMKKGVAYSESSVGFSVDTVRKDFAILSETMNNKPLVYLDSAATSLKPRQVLEAIAYYDTKKTANVHRGVYKLASEATDLYEAARETVASFINAKSQEVVFTKGATEALNLVALSYGLHNLKPGDEIITTELEHHSSFLPWQNVAKITGAVLKFVPLDGCGRITIENFESVLSDKTKVVAINYVSNVLGYISPIKDICKLAHTKGAIVTVDAAQAAAHLKIDVIDIGCDFLALTGHKMLGPTGVGVLYGRYELLNNMQPVSFGGEMIDLVELSSSTYKDAPYRFEAGTPVISGAIGLKAAIDYIASVGLASIHNHELALVKYAIDQLKSIEDIILFNPSTDIGIISFNLDGVHPHDMATVYDVEGVCMRAGHHCAQPLMAWLKQSATLRASIYLYNTKDDIDAMIRATILGKDAFINGIF